MEFMVIALFDHIFRSLFYLVDISTRFSMSQTKKLVLMPPYGHA